MGGEFLWRLSWQDRCHHEKLLCSIIIRILLLLFVCSIQVVLCCAIVPCQAVVHCHPPCRHAYDQSCHQVYSLTLGKLDCVIFYMSSQVKCDKQNAIYHVVWCNKGQYTLKPERVSQSRDALVTRCDKLPSFINRCDILHPHQQRRLNQKPWRTIVCQPYIKKCDIIHIESAGGI